MRSFFLLYLSLGALQLTPVSAWSTFVVPHTDGADDTPALAAVLASGNITTNNTILFEKGVTYNIFSPIKFPVLTNVEVRIEGNLTYPDSIETVQGALVWSYSLPRRLRTPSSGGCIICELTVH